MHISIYYIYIYTCGIWRTFLLYKVLIGWLECLRIILVREEFRCFEFPFPAETNTRPHRSGGFGTKDCMIFLLKKNKEKSESYWERKRCLRIALTFLDNVIQNPLLQLWNQQWFISWERPSPQSHDPITADHMHGNPLLLRCTAPCLDFVLFLKWYRSLWDISSGPLVSTRGLRGCDCAQSRQRKTCVPFLLLIFFWQRVLGGRGFTTVKTKCWIL